MRAIIFFVNVCLSVTIRTQKNTKYVSVCLFSRFIEILNLKLIEFWNSIARP